MGGRGKRAYLEVQRRVEEKRLPNPNLPKATPGCFLLSEEACCVVPAV